MMMTKEMRRLHYYYYESLPCCLSSSSSRRCFHRRCPSSSTKSRNEFLRSRASRALSTINATGSSLTNFGLYRSGPLCCRAITQSRHDRSMKSQGHMAIPSRSGKAVYRPKERRTCLSVGRAVRDSIATDSR